MLLPKIVLLSFVPLAVNPPQVATHFSVSAPANVIYGIPFNVTVTALDESEATVTSYTGTVHFTSSSTGTLPSDYTFTSADGGVHVFGVTLTAAGMQSVTATDTINASINGKDHVFVQILCPPSVPFTAVINADDPVCTGSTGNVATVTSPGSTFEWSIVNGTLTSGQGTASITYTAGLSGNVQLTVVPWLTTGCQAATSGRKTVAISQPPTAELPSTIHTCQSSTVDVTADLIGTAPFTVLWSDGVLQTNLLTNQATRTITVNGDTVLAIDEISDAACTNDNPNEHVAIVADGLPVITDQTRHVQIASGNTTTLSITTPMPNIAVEWFEGTFGDTSHPVGGHSLSYTTPALTHTTRYWFRLTNACGMIDSQPITVTVNGRRRAVGH